MCRTQLPLTEATKRRVNWLVLCGPLQEYELPVVKADQIEKWNSDH